MLTGPWLISSPLRQGVVPWLCSNWSFCVFASTCRWVCFAYKENSRTGHSIAHTVSAYIWKTFVLLLSSLLGGSCAVSLRNTGTRGNHQLIAKEMKGRVLCGFFPPPHPTPFLNCKSISQFLHFSLWRFIRFQNATTIPFCSLFGKVVWTNWEHLSILGSTFGRASAFSYFENMKCGNVFWVLKRT